MEICAILKAQTDAAADSSNLLINSLEEVAGFRGSGSWIQKAATCTLLIKYIRENVKIATFSRLSGVCKIKRNGRIFANHSFTNSIKREELCRDYAKIQGEPQAYSSAISSSINYSPKILLILVMLHTYCF